MLTITIEKPLISFIALKSLLVKYKIKIINNRE
jgi:hypothetical protein